MSEGQKAVRYLSQHPFGWSNVVEVTGGRLVFITGQQAWDASGQIVGDTYREQIEVVFRNLEKQLQVVGATFHDLVKLTIIAREDFAENGQHYAEVRDQYIDVANPPASGLTLAPRLADPKALIDIAAIAHLPA